MLSAILSRAGILTDVEWRRFLKRWLLIALVLHLLAAIFSAGWYHADEHFQILEFLNWKLGRSSAMDLPMEFHERLRPWLQPTLYLIVAKALSYLGLDDPFGWAFAFRLVSAAAGFVGLASLTLCCYRWFPNPLWRRRAVMLQVLLWFLPALHARHSSENLSGAVMMIAVSLAFLVPELAATWIGFLCGLAFEFRYQTGLMIPGLLLWLVVHPGLRARCLFRMALGIFLALGIGFWIDAWGYHQWTLTPWRYFEYNLVQGHVSDVDRSPVWDYFRRAFTESWPLLGFFSLLAFVVGWLRRPGHVLTWTLVPFFVVHALIGHKELRFLFPMAHAAGVMIAFAIADMGWPRRLARALIAWNAVGLAVTTLVPAWTPIRFYDYVYHHPVRRIGYLNGDNPYVVNGIPMNFYRPVDMELFPADSSTQGLSGEIFARKASTLKNSAGTECQLEFRALPFTLPPIAAADRITSWSLFRCP